MDRRLVVGGLLAGLACLMSTGSALAGDRADPPDLGQLLERIEILEQDKGRMQDELDELRVQAGQDWLTEQRAEEVKNLVADVLADADTRSSMAQDGMTAGWDGHFFLGSSDGRFRIQVQGIMQFRYVWNFRDQGDRFLSGFENTRTRLEISGHVFTPDLTYMVQSDFVRGGGFALLQDAYIRYQLDNNWAVRFGQFKIPFNREKIVDPQYLQIVERSLVNESHNIGRSQGVELQYQDAVNHFSFMFNDGPTDNIGGGGFVGVSGQNTTALSPDTEFSMAARWEYLAAGNWEQFRDFTSPPGEPYGLMFGLAGHWMVGEFGNPFLNSRDEDRWVGLAMDVNVEWGGANLFASLTYHLIDDIFNGQIHNVGVVLQGGAYFSPRFEAYARFEYGRLDVRNIDFEDLFLITMGGNYYFDGNDVKFSADIGFGISQIDTAFDSDIAGWRSQVPGSEPQVVIRAQFQLVF